VEGEEGRGWEVSGVGNPANSTYDYAHFIIKIGAKSSLVDDF